MRTTRNLSCLQRDHNLQHVRWLLLMSRREGVRELSPQLLWYGGQTACEDFLAFRYSRGARMNRITGSRLFCLFGPHLPYGKIKRAILTFTVKHIKSDKLEMVNKN